MNAPFDRKAALRAYKERTVRAGIYGVRCAASGRTWPGAAADLDTVRNGLWLRLQHGRHLDRELQAAWQRLGEAAFDFVILEVLEEEANPFVLRETLKAKEAAWRARLQPGPGQP